MSVKCHLGTPVIAHIVHPEAAPPVWDITESLCYFNSLRQMDQMPRGISDITQYLCVTYYL